MASVTLESGAYVGFKLGKQDDLNAKLALGTGANATHGHFYLTSDTHRLYIGNKDGSISAVNQGVITMNNTSDITSLAVDNIEAGQFYYAKNDNVLCVYSGSANGWVQINSNTDTKITGDTFSVATTTANTKVTVSNTLTQTGGNTAAQGTFTVASDTGVLVTKDGTSGIKISGDKFTLSSNQNTTDTKNVDIKLTSTNNTAANSSISLVAGDNVTLTDNGSGAITIASSYTDTNIHLQSLETTVDANGKYTITAKNNNNGTMASTDFTPTIKIGSATEAGHTFASGTAILPVYTKTEINDLLKGLNAMTYKGAIAGTAVTVDTTTNQVTGVTVDGSVVKPAAGDVYLINEGSFTCNDVVYGVGTLLIAQGEEGTDGKIANPTYTVVEESRNTDTTYTFTKSSASSGEGGGMVVKSKVGSATTTVGSLTVVAGKVTDAASLTAAVSGADSAPVVTLTHETVTRNDTDNTASATTQSALSNLNIDVITGVTTDATGHVTGVTKSRYTAIDTNGSVKSVAIAASANDDKNLGTLKTTVASQNSNGSQNGSADASATIGSSTLQITASGTTGLVMDMVWGSF